MEGEGKPCGGNGGGGGPQSTLVTLWYPKYGVGPLAHTRAWCLLQPGTDFPPSHVLLPACYCQVPGQSADALLLKYTRASQATPDAPLFFTAR